MKTEEKEPEKYTLDQFKVLIFVPLSACGCCYENFLNRVFEVLNPYREHLDFSVEDAAGWTGNKYNIIRNCVVIEWNEDLRCEFLMFDKIHELKEFFDECVDFERE